MEYLQWEGDIDVQTEIQEQIKQKLYSLFEGIELGYSDRGQQDRLITNAGHIQSTLCFVQKYWNVLFRAEFPFIPDTEEYPTSKLLIALQTTSRQKKRV